METHPYRYEYNTREPGQLMEEEASSDEQGKDCSQDNNGGGERRDTSSPGSLAASQRWRAQSEATPSLTEHVVALHEARNQSAVQVRADIIGHARASICR